MRKKLVCTTIGLMALAGCGSPAPAVSTSPSPTTVAISLTNGTASPIGQKVDLVKGQSLTLDITSDRTDEVHLHGFDKEISVAPGTTAETIVADRTGSYEVECHNPAITILILQIR